MATYGITNIRRGVLGFYKKYARFREALDGWTLSALLDLSDHDLEYMFKYALEASGLAPIKYSEAVLATPEEMRRNKQRHYYASKGYTTESFEVIEEAFLDDLDPETLLIYKETFYGKAE